MEIRLQICAAWACACLGVLPPGEATLAQPDSSAAGQERVAAPAQAPQPRIDYDSEPPYTFYERQWNRRFPAPYRKPFRREYYPYGRPYYPRRAYGFDSLSPWNVYRYEYGYPGTEIFDEGYIGGFEDGRRFQKWQYQAEVGSASYVKAMEQGVGRFRAGDYGAAAKQFILAAKLNQGDPASRLHAVHALTALGHYTAAVPALRRALQLQPRLVYLPLDIRAEYGQPGDLREHLGKLAASAEQTANDAGLWLLLGYYRFFTGAPQEAAAALEKAVRLAPDDSAAVELYDAARLSAPADATVQPATPQRSSQVV